MFSLSTLKNEYTLYWFVHGLNAFVFLIKCSSLHMLSVAYSFNNGTEYLFYDPALSSVLISYLCSLLPIMTYYVKDMFMCLCHECG